LYENKTVKNVNLGWSDEALTTIGSSSKLQLVAILLVHR